MFVLLPPPCSTNGTEINMSKLVKKQSHMLQSGDVIYFVYRKTEPEQSESGDIGHAALVVTTP